jgi:murein L,D-transpeptidase YcbB/YkuD
MVRGAKSTMAQETCEIVNGLRGVIAGIFGSRVREQKKGFLMLILAVRRHVLSGLAAAALVVSGIAAPAPSQAQAFAALNQAIAEASGIDEDLARFYRERDFTPIWTVSEAADRRNALLAALENAQNHGLPTSRYDPDVLRNAFRDATNPYLRGQADVLASRMFLQYAHDVNSGMLNPENIAPGIVHTVQRADSGALLAGLMADNPRLFMATLPPQHPEYNRLMRTKLHLEQVVDAGGYGPAVQSGSLAPGQSGNAVVQMRNRLIAMGYLARSASATYDAQLQTAVADFQSRNGLSPDGVAGGGTMRALNRSAEDHLSEVIVAMERQRWLNVDRGERHIFVNIPDFHVRLMDHEEVTFITRSVVGAVASDRSTPEFSDMMDHMVINPSWFVPRSIARRSYIPNIIAGGSTYMEVSRGGRAINPRNVDMSQYSVNNFPFDLRQPPGPRNALGYVKFMFPNQWNIYLHDTPEDHLFNSDVRTFSSGCVRLAEPFEFAYTLLSAQEDDPVAYFHRILDSGNETRVNLETPLPVHITYWTAWVTPDGRLNLRDDVYGRNAIVRAAILDAGVAVRGVNS